MSSDPLWFEQTRDELHDDEYPDPDDSDNERTETILCPECGASIYEDAPQCPACGAYVTSGNNLWSKKPTWWILLAVLGILAVLAMLARS